MDGNSLLEVQGKRREMQADHRHVLNSEVCFTIDFKQERPLRSLVQRGHILRAISEICSWVNDFSPLSNWFNILKEISVKYLVSKMR
jgi:hypothetical protein